MTLFKNYAHIILQIVSFSHNEKKFAPQD